MANRAIGIYFSSKHLDVIELTGSPHAPQVANFFREKISAVSYDALEHEDEKKLQSSYASFVSATIKVGLLKVKGRTTGVFSVLPSSDVMVRYFSMPPLPASEQETAIRFEARKYIPFKIDEVVSDYKILPASKTKKTMDVFFIAAPRERLNNHLEIFKKAETTAIGVDVIPFALIRVLFLTKKLTGKESIAVLYIDSDREALSIYVIEMGLPFLSRDLKVSIDDKESFFEKVGSELRLSIDYYYRQNPGAEISKIIVCGEMVFHGLDAYIADELKIITESLDQLTAIRGANTVPPSALIALGTALTGLGRSRYSINLSPTAITIKRKRLAKLFLYEAVAGLSVIGVLFLALSIQLAKDTTQLNAIKKEGSSLKAYNLGLSVDGLAKLKNDRFGEVKFLQALVNDKLVWADRLDMLVKQVPKEIWISGIAATGVFTRGKADNPYMLKRDIIIEAKAFSLDPAQQPKAINKFFSSIRQDEVFMSSFPGIEFGAVDKETIKGYTVSSFTISSQKKQEEPTKGEAKWRRKR